MKRFLCRYGIATWLGAIHTACGVYMGEPIRLFPERHDGGIPASESCDFARTRVSGNVETTVAATGAELYDLAAYEYMAPLKWLRGTSTTVHVTLSEIEVYSVDATRNPEYDHFSETPECQDHATIEAAVYVRTADGRLDEHIGKMKFTAYDDFEAHGSATFGRDAITGTYQPFENSGCFQGLDLRLLIARDGLHGTLGEDVEGGACDDPVERPVSEYAVARWGKRANNYGN